MNMLYTCDPIKYAGMKLNFKLIIFLFRMLRPQLLLQIGLHRVPNDPLQLPRGHLQEHSDPRRPPTNPRQRGDQVPLRARHPPRGPPQQVPGLGPGGPGRAPRGLPLGRGCPPPRPSRNWCPHRRGECHPSLPRSCKKRPIPYQTSPPHDTGNSLILVIACASI